MKNIYFAYRSFWPELETMKKFRETGVKTICFFAANTVNSLGEPYCKYPPIWVWHNKYNFEALDSQVEDILSAVPDAELICMVDLNTPMWWVRQFGYNANAYDSLYGLGKIASSEKWRNDTSAYLEAFLEYAEKKYGGRIKAYLLACGGTCEWQDRSDGEESKFRLAGYQKWAAEHKLPVPEDVPPRSVRDHAEHGLLRDPVVDKSALDYWKFCNDQIVDTIDFFAKKTKNIIRPETEIGVFYGYILELDQSRMISEGYLEYERLCDIPEIDFIIGPGTYADRKIGEGSGFMVAHETLRLKGKRYLHECDQRTHTYNRWLSEHVECDYEGWPDEESTVAGLKREMSLCLINKASLWWFDMWSGFYQGEKVFNNFKAMKMIWDEYIDIPVENAAEILMVVDPESTYFLNERERYVREFNQQTRKKLNQIGAPYEICSFNDLPDMDDIDRYKMIIFTSSFVMNDVKRKILNKYVLKDQRTVLWFYAPGIINNGKWQPGQVENLCGTAFETAGINIVEKDDWKSVYVFDPAELAIKDMRRLGEDAGVHFYTPDGHPVYANDKLLAVHTAIAERLQVKIPCEFGKLTELFSGKIWKDASCIELNTKGPDTFLFLLEN